MAQDKFKLAVNDIQAAKKRGAELYEVKSNNVTLEFSPRLQDIRSAVSRSISCNVFLYSATGDKHLVAARRNRRMVLNTINLQVQD